MLNLKFKKIGLILILFCLVSELEHGLNLRFPKLARTRDYNQVELAEKKHYTNCVSTQIV